MFKNLLTRITVAFVVIILQVTSFSNLIVNAASTQLGVGQITLNSGGGIQTNGSDGLRFTINSAQNGDWSGPNYSIAGQDGVVYRNTYQYCCSAGSPMLNIGGTLYGQGGPAQSTDNWSSIEILSTSGAATIGARTSQTGNASATVMYTVVHSGRTYTIVRNVTYVYPNDFVTDNYTFTIPSGNTDAVKFYLGGDTAPGSSDQGYGIVLTQPVRSVISLNTSSQIMFGFREIYGGRPFDGATSQSFYNPYSIVENGGDIGFVEEASNHDAGLMMQWNLGSTPGTYTGSFQQFSTQQGTNLNATFAEEFVDPNDPIQLDISVANTDLDPVSSIGYTITLPSGLLLTSGGQSNNCGGTLTAVNNTNTIVLSGANVNGASNCIVSVLVDTSDPGKYTLTASNATGLSSVSNNIGSSSVSVGVYTLSFITQGGSNVADTVEQTGESVVLPTALQELAMCFKIGIQLIMDQAHHMQQVLHT